MRYAVFAALSLGCGAQDGEIEIEAGETETLIWASERIDCSAVDGNYAETEIPWPSVWQVMGCNDISDPSTGGPEIDGVQCYVVTPESLPSSSENGGAFRSLTLSVPCTFEEVRVTYIDLG